MPPKNKITATHQVRHGRFSVTNALPYFRRRKEMLSCRSSDLCLGQDRHSLPRFPQWPAFTTGTRPEHPSRQIQRRYRSGFSPDSLFKQVRPTAPPATRQYFVVSPIIPPIISNVNHCRTTRTPRNTRSGGVLIIPL